ncbi:MAG: hypothetical protein HN374_05850 [Cryomorphaceae bacterium]|jgi:DNA ligase D-like protein (predicted 3'-phosphoesterase)|nr:hypothetical protein [Cryomorphaceae bacterium]
MSKFIVIEHDANRAGKHFDIRFQIPNSTSMWASFACRKDIPINTGTKILAIRTKDHTSKEALFTGKIESGYGAGTLKKWDGGNCNIEKYSNSHISIDFKGSKMKGIYHFVNTKVMNKKDKGESYMLFKGKI